MTNDLTDLFDEVSNLRTMEKVGAPEQPADGTSQDAPQEAGPPPSPPLGPPRFIGINFEDGNVVISSVGNFVLEPDEAKEIVKICLKALTRSLYDTFGQVATHHGLEVPKRTGLKTAADNVS